MECFVLMLIFRRLRHLTILIALGLSPAIASADGQLIIHNARIFTGDSRQPEAQALVVTDDKIAFVGSSAGALSRRSSATRIIDAAGRRVIPGLVDAHAHSGPDIRGRQVRPPAGSKASPEQLLEEIARLAPQGNDWLLATVGDQVTSDARDWRASLDQAAPNRPVMLHAWWGHGTYLNSQALTALGIQEHQKDPFDGWFGRRDDGTLNGMLREGPELVLLRQLIDDGDAVSASAAFEADARRYLAWGVTTVHQLSHNLSADSALAALSREPSGLRWRLYAWGTRELLQPSARLADPAIAQALPARVRVAGVKWALDGTPMERDAHVRAAYADRPNWFGRSNFSDADLKALLERGLEREEQLAFHVVGDREIERLLTTMETLGSAHLWKRHRVRIEHGDGLMPDLFARARRLGVVLVQNPLHLAPMTTASSGDVMTERYGELAKQFQNLRATISAGIPLALGSDASGSASNPFLNMMLAVTYERHPKQALSREQALIAYTQGGAFAEHAEKAQGKLIRGYAADLAILSQDPLTAPIEDLPKTRSVLTVVRGKVVFDELEKNALSLQH